MMPTARPDEAAARPPDLAAELVSWFLRRNGPHWKADDEQAFEQWLRSDPRHGAAYAQWEADWALMDDMSPASAARLRAMVHADRRAGQPLQPVRRPPARRQLLTRGLAFAGVAGLGLAGTWLGWQHRQTQPVYTQSFGTDRGQQLAVALPDGSTLRLDSSTALKATYLRHRREVQLVEGQVLFDVEHDAERPFIVLAQAVAVTVLGTRFSVRLTPGVPDRDGVEVAVEQGRVRVARAAVNDARSLAAAAAPTFDLTAGQRLVIGARGGRASLAPVPAEGIAPWRDPQLSFSDVPLRSAVAEMERYSSLGIVSIDPAVAGLRLSGTFDPRDAAATRRLLAGALPIRMQPAAGGLAVVPDR